MMRGLAAAAALLSINLTPTGPALSATAENPWKALSFLEGTWSDLLYVNQEAAGQPLRAIYLDNEGHVIHYVVSTPEATTVNFFSEASPQDHSFNWSIHSRMR